MRAVCSQIFIHIIFPVKDANNLIPQEHLEELHSIMAGIISKKGQEQVLVGGTSSHIHVFLDMKPEVIVSNFIKSIKNESAKFINHQQWLTQKFSWHEDYGAFSYSYSQVEKVCEYIKNEETHHKTMTFREEFVAFLNKFEVEYDEEDLPVDFEKRIVTEL
jgi:REP element-mobilizing transposase RayT